MRLIAKNRIATLLGLLLIFSLFQPVALADGGKVAKIGETEYETFAQAVAAAEDGETVTLLKDCDHPWSGYANSITLEKSLTLQLDGHTLSCAGDDVFYVNDGTFTIEDRVGTGGVHATGDNGWTVLNVDGGDVVVNGGKIEADMNNTLVLNSGSILFNGGRCDHDKMKNFLADGLEAFLMDDGCYAALKKTVSVSKSAVDFTAVNTQETISATVSAPDSGNATWSSSDTGIASVDQNGRITAVAIGSAIIRATAPNGSYDTCLVTIGAPAVLNVTQNKQFASLQVAANEAQNNDELQLISDIAPVQTVVFPAGKTVTLDLNGKNIASNYNGVVLQNDGTLTIKGEGQVYTTDTSASGNNIIVNNGTITIEDGFYRSGTGNLDTTDNGYILNNKGQATITGGTFYGYTAYSMAIANSGTLTIDPATENSVKIWDAHGIVGCGEGTVTINGGLFSVSPSKTRANGNSDSCFYAYGTGTIIINDCTMKEGVRLLYSDGGNATIEVNGGYLVGMNGSEYAVNDWSNPYGNIDISGGTFRAVALKDWVAGPDALNSTITNSVKVLSSVGDLKNGLVEGAVQDLTTGTVSIPATALSITDGEIYDKATIVFYGVGEKKALGYTVEPSNATVVWSSSNPNVATVKNDVVTALADGTTVIKAVAGTLSASVQVKVKGSNYLSYNEFVKALVEGSGTFDGSAAAYTDYAKDSEGRLIVKWSPVSGCRAIGTNYHQYAGCDHETAASYETPNRVNGGCAQYQITNAMASGDIDIKNVSFAYEGPESFWYDANGWYGTGAADLPGEMQLENPGNITIDNCAFDNVSLTPYHGGSTTESSLTVTDSVFTNNQKAGLRGINSKKVTVSKCTFTNCKSGAVDIVQNNNRADGDIVLTNNSIDGKNGFKLRDITNKVYVQGEETKLKVETLFSYDTQNTKVADYLIIYAGKYNLDPSNYSGTPNSTSTNYVADGYAVFNNADDDKETYPYVIFQAVTVTFNANYDGAAPASTTQVVPKNVATALDKNGFAGPTGKQFGSWNTLASPTAETAGESYADEAEVTLERDLILYAQWILPPATVETAPKAKTLTYNGQKQDLVEAGVATGGTMQYALGMDDQTAPTDGWGSDIPTGKDATTYYVWYKAVGDGTTHSDSKPVCVRVTIHSYNPPAPGPAPKPVDTSALEEALAEADAVDPEKVEGGWEELQAAVEAGDRVMDKGNPTQAEVDDAAKAIRDAIDALVYKPEPVPVPEARGWYRGEDGRWYYEVQLLGGVADLKSEWLKWNGEWYYLKADGAMAREQWAKVDGKWYYFDGEGIMLRYRGLFWQGSWYWLKDQGEMAQDEVINIGYGDYEYDHWGRWVAYEQAKQA